MSKEVKKRERSGRKKVAAAPDKHAEQCQICNHEQKAEIEAAFARFESGEQIERDFGVSWQSVYRHTRYYELGKKRIANTEKILELIVERGMVKGADVPVNMIVESVKELHKVRGKHKEPAKNPETAAREAYERLRQDFIDIPDETIRQRVAERYGVQESVLIH